MLFKYSNYKWQRMLSSWSRSVWLSDYYNCKNWSELLMQHFMSLDQLKPAGGPLTRALLVMWFSGES